MIIKEFLKSNIREDKIFALSYTKQIISLAERLYNISKEDKLIKIIDNLYQVIEKYDINKKYN